jgi:hypothetical protein
MCGLAPCFNSLYAATMTVQEIDYLELRDHSVDPGTGTRFDFGEPCLVHADHAKFLETLMSRVAPDGAVDMDEWTTQPIESTDITGLSGEQIAELQSHLAQVLFQAARRTADFRDNREWVISHEGFVATQLAPYRDQPEFLREVTRIADAAAARWQPSVI